MKPRMVVLIMTMALAGAAQRQGAPPGPPPGSASVRGSGGSLGSIRLGAADPIWFTWRIGIPSNVFRTLTFTEAAAKADALGLGYIEGFSTQNLSPEIPKKLDYRLAPGEREALSGRLRELNMRMVAYHTLVPADRTASKRKHAGGGGRIMRTRQISAALDKILTR